MIIFSFSEHHFLERHIPFTQKVKRCYKKNFHLCVTFFFEPRLPFEKRYNDVQKARANL